MTVVATLCHTLVLNDELGLHKEVEACLKSITYRVLINMNEHAAICQSLFTRRDAPVCNMDHGV